MLLKKKETTENPEGQMELVEHLAELRSRLFRIIIYILVGMAATYGLFPSLYALLGHPLFPILNKMGGEVIVTNVTEAFLLRMQTSFIAGLAAAFPFVTLELWGFISPALTPQERKPIIFLAPFSILLFLAGVGTSYASLPAALSWMASFVSDIPNAKLYQNAQQLILLNVKILLAGGVAFQLPIILLFLSRVGLVTADMMIKYWRHAIVILAAAAALITPSTDPLTMMIIGIPMTGLYVLSISLVRAFEPKEDGTRGLSFATMLLVALAPVGILAAVGYWLWRTHGG